MKPCTALLMERKKEQKRVSVGLMSLSTRTRGTTGVSGTHGNEHLSLYTFPLRKTNCVSADSMVTSTILSKDESTRGKQIRRRGKTPVDGVGEKTDGAMHLIYRNPHKLVLRSTSLDRP